MRNTFPLFILICIAALVTGCATHGRRTNYSTTIESDFSSGSMAFSDDVSRDLVRQTRHLIKLRDTDYLVGADDVLEISVFEWETSEQTETLEFRVSESGYVSLPSVGAIKVGNHTIQQIQTLIETAFEEKNVLQNPRIWVSVKEYRSRRISVLGEVNAPGVYAIHENVSTVMDMLTLAGGPTREAGQIAYVLRKQKGQYEPLRIMVDLEDLFENGSFDLNAVLHGDDIIYVPKAPLVYVYGNVRMPGGFPMRRSMRALEAVALAGGLDNEADKQNCFLVRRSKDNRESTVAVNLYDIERGVSPDIFLQESDVLHVPDSSAKIAGHKMWEFFRGIFTFTYRLDQ
ncbi:SLBB domain-containing protein [PVC group bacterium]|nr:SLBB domain-containing protein [PVC group bacterium]